MFLASSKLVENYCLVTSTCEITVGTVLGMCLSCSRSKLVCSGVCRCHSVVAFLPRITGCGLPSMATGRTKEEVFDLPHHVLFLLPVQHMSVHDWCMCSWCMMRGSRMEGLTEYCTAKWCMQLLGPIQFMSTCVKSLTDLFHFSRSSHYPPPTLLEHLLNKFQRWPSLLLLLIARTAKRGLVVVCVCTYSFLCPFQRKEIPYPGPAQGSQSSCRTR